MANALRSDFLGATLQRSGMSSAKMAERVQTQAFFSSKAPKKAEKAAKVAPKKAEKAVKQIEKKVQKAVPQAKKVVPQVQKKAAQVTKQVKKAASGKSTKGWFGGQGGASDLDRWYGEYFSSFWSL